MLIESQAEYKDDSAAYYHDLELAKERQASMERQQPDVKSSTT